MQASLALAFKVCRFMELLAEFMMVEYCSQWKTNGMKFESSKARWITSFFKVLFYIVSSNLPSLECLLSHHSYLESVNKLSLQRLHPEKANIFSNNVLLSSSAICITVQNRVSLTVCGNKAIFRTPELQISNAHHFCSALLSTLVNSKLFMAM